MIRLYEWDTLDFSTGGIGSLPDVKECVVIEELNGIFELEMKYPVTGHRYADILPARIVRAKPNPHTKPQPFRIYRASKPINGTVTFYARHISYDLFGIPVKVFNWGDVEAALTKYNLQEAMNVMKDNVVGTCPFNFISKVPTTVVDTMQTNKPESFRSLMISGTRVEKTLVDLYDCEFEYDEFTVIAHEHRGSNKGYILQYGKNITNMKLDENISSTYTHVYPYYYQKDDGLQYLKEYVIPTGYENSQYKVMMLDLTAEFDEMPVESLLRDKASQYIKDEMLGSTVVSLDVSFVNLEYDPELAFLKELITVSLGDYVTVKNDRLLANDIVRCVRTEYNVLLDRYIKISLGQPIVRLADVIAKKNSQQVAPATGVKPVDISTAIDNDKIVKDAETGKVYKWVVVSRNGAPEITLVEV